MIPSVNQSENGFVEAPERTKANSSPTRLNRSTVFSNTFNNEPSFQRSPFNNSRAAERYSPQVSPNKLVNPNFMASESTASPSMGFNSTTMGNNFIKAAAQNNYNSDLPELPTKRAYWTNLETPKRAKHISTLMDFMDDIENMDDIEFINDNDNNSFKSSISPSKYSAHDSPFKMASSLSGLPVRSPRSSINQIPMMSSHGIPRIPQQPNSIFHQNNYPVKNSNFNISHNVPSLKPDQRNSSSMNSPFVVEDSESPFVNPEVIAEEFRQSQNSNQESVTLSYEGSYEGSDFKQHLDNMSASMGSDSTRNSNFNYNYNNFRNSKAFADINKTMDAESVLTDSLGDRLYEGVPESHQLRRDQDPAAMTQVPLEGPNLVLRNAVPSRLLRNLPINDDDEFQFMRYTACTSDPDEFIKNGFTLRQSKNARETELVICITMYNEDEIAFTRTMHAVQQNIAHLCSRNKSQVWGEDSWKKVQVVIVGDGRSIVSPGVLEVLAAMGVYQDGIAKSFVNSKEVTAHLFEYTTQVSIDSNLKFQTVGDNVVPVQVLFCLKEKNQKKINSHRWLFNAFCPVLDPNVCVLLDVGTRPHKDAIYHLWKAFDNDSNVGGAAGEIIAMKEKGGLNLLNPLVASQNFEYKMSNILDKPLESVFGYISVLPGALSAYRYTALRNHDDGTGPLCSYFKGETFTANEANRDVFTANMYLAEDRILCWELVAKKQEKWVLKYVKQAKGETDVPDNLPEFISQRRRWLNGALFAALYSQLNFRQVWDTDHSVMRKVFLHVEFFYQFIQLLFSFFSLGNFYLAFYFLGGSLAASNAIPHNGGYWIFTILNYLCVCDLTSIFIISMGNRPQGAKHLYFSSMILLTVCAVYSLICGLYFVGKTVSEKNDGVVSSSVFFDIVISLLSTYGLYAFMSIIYLDPWHIITSSVQYFLMLPSYTCTLQIYAFCNTHDVSWGTKGDNNPTKSLGSFIVGTNDAGKFVMVPGRMNVDEAYDEVLHNLKYRRQQPRNVKELVKKEIPEEDYYRDIRTRVVLMWLLSNMLLIMIVTQVYTIKDTSSNKYLAFILWSVACLALFRSIGSLTYLFLMAARWIVKSKSKLEEGGHSLKVPKFKVSLNKNQ